MRIIIELDNQSQNPTVQTIETKQDSFSAVSTASPLDAGAANIESTAMQVQSIADIFDSEIVEFDRNASNVIDAGSAPSI